jgi:phospholipase C
MLLSCAGLAVLLIGLGSAAPPAGAAEVSGATAPATATDTAARLPTATPIKHLVIIYDENVSFDHYFATYPMAANPSGEPAFQATGPTPTANTLAAANLLSGNPNFTNRENGANAADPFRLDRTQAATADQNHAYAAEQQAYNAGKTNLFPKFTGKGTPGGVGAFGTRGQVMGYYDGNTVTALWNYAQHFAMSDNAYSDTYGPSTPGALEVVSGQTNGVKIVATTQKPFNLKTAATSYYVEDGAGGIGMINDVDPGYDLCSKPKDQVMMDGRNIGTLLNQAGISWGGFMGGFDLGLTNGNGTTGCKRSTYSDVVHSKILDYIPHHNWFQYHASTANPTHARPAATADIGYSFDAPGRADPANHEYDLKDFYAAVTAGDFPAVSYIKPPAYQDAHAGYSDPLDEQEGLVDLINFVQHQPGWKDTAILVVYDDSDGWYDHAFAKPSNPSADAQADQLDGPGECGTGTPLPGVAGKPVNGRCGPGTRVPFLVISPWAKPDAITHDLITQASVLHFIEDNWLKGERLGGGSFDASAGSIMDMFDFQGSGQAPPLFLDAKTGEVETAAQ